MRHFVVLCTLAVALVVPGVVHAGGWATVGFTPLPDGTVAGATWSPEITVLQHGVTPLAGLSPVVRISHVDSGKEKSFTAAETKETGVYSADVVFPSSGDWRVVVESGFWGEGGTVTYGPVAIAPPPTAAAPGSFPTISVAVAALLAVAVAAGFVGLRRTRRLRPAS
jgi:YtkA-like